MLRRVSRALRAELPAPTDVLGQAAFTVGRRVAAVASARQAARFEQQVERLFSAFVIEAEMRQRGSVLGLREFLPIREVTVGLGVLFEIGCIGEGIELSPAEALMLEPLARQASLIVALSNDVHTYPKELEAGELENVVFILAKSSGCPPARPTLPRRRRASPHRKSRLPIARAIARGLSR